MTNCTPDSTRVRIIHASGRQGFMSRVKADRLVEYYLAYEPTPGVIVMYPPIGGTRMRGEEEWRPWDSGGHTVLQLQPLRNRRSKG